MSAVSSTSPAGSVDTAGIFGAGFLINPDLFPARRAGEVWGGREVALALPGGPYRFAGLNAAQEEAVRGRFGTYCDSLGGESGAAVDSVLFRAAETDFRTFDLRGWEYGLDLDAAPDAVRLAGLRLVGRLDWRPSPPGRLAGGLWTPDGGGVAFAGIFENFLRVLVAYRLQELGGAVLHCAAVSCPQGARLFLGRSGAGKSTVSRLAEERGLTVLSDDLNALCPDADGAPAARVEKLPFTGDYGDSRTPFPSVPLAGLYRLEKDTTDALRPLSRAEAVACLLACSPYVNADPHRHDGLLTNLLRLAASSGRAQALRFSLGGSFWPILDQ
jgi:hypothetical protein